jgi:RNA polymerase sigma factor (sigma-70 family)
MSNLKYEDKSEELDLLLSKYRGKWQLDAISWLDYNDVCQIIRLHIFTKWHLWDQKRPFKPWASTTICNQIKNLVRNHYSNFTKPCLKCPHYQGGDGCALNKSGVQDEECALFAKWKKKKERAYNLKLPLPIEDGLSLGESYIEDNIDFDKSKDKLHALIMCKLTPRHSKIYKMLFIDHLSDEEVAKICKFKKDSSKRKTIRYKQIDNLKRKFYEMAQQVLKDEDIL